MAGRPITRARKALAAEQAAVIPIKPDVVPVQPGATNPKPDRPYDQAVVDEILRRMSLGETLRRICKDEAMPSEASVRRWALDDEHGFAERYFRARSLCMDAWGDECLDIADDNSRDVILREGVPVVDHDHINRAKLKIDTRKWIMQKLHPDQYGEYKRVSMDVSGHEDWLKKLEGAEDGGE